MNHRYVLISFILFLISVAGCQLKPKDAEGYYDRGCAHMFRDRDINHDKEAIQDFTEAIRLDPDFAAAYQYRGQMYYGKSKYDEAIKDYSEAIELCLKHTHDKHRYTPIVSCVYFSRGQVYDKLLKYTEAIKDYTESIRLDSRSLNAASAYLARGNAYKKVNKLKESEKDIAKAKQLQDNYKQLQLKNERSSKIK